RALEEARREVARLGQEVLGARPLAVTLLAVTQEALALVHGLARVHVLRECRRRHQRCEDKEECQRDRTFGSIDPQWRGSGGAVGAPRLNGSHAPPPPPRPGSAPGRPART